MRGVKKSRVYTSPNSKSGFPLLTANYLAETTFSFVISEISPAAEATLRSSSSAIGTQLIGQNDHTKQC
jgi:hypothetical protein